MTPWKRFLYRVYMNGVDQEEPMDNVLFKMTRNACFFWGIVIGIIMFAVGVIFVSLMIG